MAAYGLTYNSMFQVRFNQYDNNAIPIDGISLDDISVTGIPARRFVLTLPSEATEGSGMLAGQGTVSLGAPVPTDLTVQLGSSDPSKLAVPATVIIPAGASSATFDLNLLDNQLLDGTQPVAINVSAADHVPASAVLNVDDNETAKLELKIDGKAKEGDKPGKRRGKLKVKPEPQKDVTVILTSSDPTEVKVPPFVVIPRGQKKDTSFDLTVMDDLELDGPQEVTITAHVANWTDGRDTIQVRDNDKRQLSVNLPALVSEGNGVLAAAGLVRLAATQTNEQVVELSSSDTTELVVPKTVTIPVGRFSARFDLTVVDDSMIDGLRTVKVTATAKHFGKGTAEIGILDDETPLAPYDPHPGDGVHEVPVDTALSWGTGIGDILVNGDFETGDLTGWTAVNHGLGGWLINDGKVNPEGPDGTLAPFAGTYSILSQQTGTGSHELYQDVTIPAGAKAATLSWMDRVRNHSDRFVPLIQEFRVEIRNVNNAVLEVLYRTQPGDPLLTDWEQRTYDLIRYRGQTIRLAFVEMDDLTYFNLHLDNISLSLGEAAADTYDVYFGTQPRLGPQELLGTAAKPFWKLPSLALNTTYYWQVLAHRGPAQTWGPVWQFETRGVGAVDHLEWGDIGSPQFVNQPFPVTLSARDNIGNVATNYPGPVSLQVLPGDGRRSAVVVSEIDSGQNDRAEFVNVSGQWLDLSGWQLTLYDGKSWPNPRIRFVVPTNSITPPGGLFVLNRFGTPPGVYPNFFTGTNIVWNNTAVSNEVAVLVQDADSNVVDFVCAAYANPTLITNPITIPPDAWEGNALPINTNAVLTWQRVGQADHDSAADWVIAENGVGALGTNLLTPFTNSVPLAVMPNTLTNFANGVWQGQLVLPQTKTPVTLLASDESGRWVLSAPIELVGSNDVAVAIHDEPDVLLVADDLTYNIVVTNTGPGAATGVWLTNRLPAAVEFVSASSSQGTCAQADGVVTCDLGTLAGESSAEVTILVRPQAPGMLANQVSVTRTELDGFYGNNTATAVSTANFPRLTTIDVITFEGDDTTTADFPVKLSAPSRLPVSVTFETSAYLATAGQDYEPLITNLVFAPGTVNQTVSVPIVGDLVNENVEIFYVHLTSPSNAVVPVPANICAIIDNDRTPVMNIGDAVVEEGPNGMLTNAVVVVTLDEPSARTVSAKYETRDGMVTQNYPITFPPITDLPHVGAATRVEDYLSQMGTVTFLPGVTNQTIQIPVVGDFTYEDNEVFSVVLSSASSVTLADNVGLGLILDDDAAELDQFEISTVPSPRYAGVPFPLTIVARDGLGRVKTDFTGTLRLSGFPDSDTITLGTEEREWNYPMNTFFHDGRLQVIYPAADIGRAGTLSALALNVSLPPGQTLSNWTIRVKHTPLTHYVLPTWETEGWTTVFANDLVVKHTGWLSIFLDTPFAYNGTASLMMDFSFDNSDYTSDGLCLASAAPEMRSTYFESDSGFGDPREWSDVTAPPPMGTNLVPNLRLLIDAPVVVSPTVIGPMVGGIWTGDITIAGPVEAMRLRVVGPTDHISIGQPFAVKPGTDSDHDGLPDAWELRYFASLNSPLGGPDDDPDQDGLSNREELRLGSNPLVPAGVVRITAVNLATTTLHLRFVTEADARYRVEWANEVNAQTWTPLGNEVEGTGGEVEVTDPGAGTQPQRFYRISRLPSQP